ncbi:hypothetical protein BV898_05028 [Hypsibius exemplaris]|uniref:Ionotropic glutamate receptor C-terminal domain-containing protein n=1 Tax=Hypsibius exemplaris TaxID=2072580 RepID=A0A1W0X0H1_HYPEX|nr:hypothetical protein BV898_05028 [Hypsibius exemplaris]
MSAGNTMYAAEWKEIWGASGGEYNCTTITFDVGSLHSTGARDVFVATNLQEVYIMGQAFENNLCARIKPEHPFETVWGGVWVLTLMNICRNLNLRCKIYQAEENGNSIGDSVVLRDLLAGSADIGMTPLLITNTRMQSNNFSVISAPEHSRYSLLMHRNFLSNHELTRDQVFLATFEPHVWVLLLLLLSLSCATLIMATKLRRLYYERDGSWRRIVLDVPMGLLTTSFPGDVITIRETLPSTVCLIVTSLLFSVLLTNTFTARIPLQLTATDPPTPPFTIISQVLQSDFKVYGSAAVRETFMASKDSDVRLLGERTIESPNSLTFYTDMANNTEERAVYLVRRENYATLANFSCDYVEVISGLSEALSSVFWFRKQDNQLATDFKRRFLRSIQNGKIRQDIGYYDKQYLAALFRPRNIQPEKCLPRPLPVKATIGRRALRMPDMGLPFIGLIVAGAVGCFLTIFERVSFNRSLNKPKRISPLERL